MARTKKAGRQGNAKGKEQAGGQGQGAAPLGAPPPGRQTPPQPGSKSPKKRKKASGSASPGVPGGGPNQWQRGQQQGQHGGEDPPSLLHDEVMQLVRHLELTPAERRRREEALAAVRSAVQLCFPTAAVELFGSLASGAASHGSDVDIAVLNLAAPPPGGQGYPKSQRPQIAGMLRTILGTMRRQGLIAGQPFVIATARIPIIKCCTKQGVDLDVAISDRSSCEAAAWQQRVSEERPLLRPLVVTLKAMLRWRGLADVATGGISSFAIVNMVLALLMTNPGTSDLGTLLVAFFRLYGREFSYKKSAVSVNRGGIVSKESVMGNGCNDDLLYMSTSSSDAKLCVEDPLTRRDISGGSYRMMEVRAAFCQALDTLERISARGMEAWSGESLLASIMDVHCVIKRPGYHHRWGQLPPPLPPAATNNTGASALPPPATLGKRGAGSGHEAQAGAEEQRFYKQPRLQAGPATLLHPPPTATLLPGRSPSGGLQPSPADTSGSDSFLKHLIHQTRLQAEARNGR